jgi:hypothetical protein
MTFFKRRFKTLNESVTLTKPGRLFQIVGAATQKAEDAINSFDTVWYNE